MAILRSGPTALEITYPFARSDAVIYDFRITWNGHDFISSKVRFTEEQASRLNEATPFDAWDYKTDKLCDTFDKTLAKNRPHYWEPIDPFVNICIIPCVAPLSAIHDWISEEGRENISRDILEYDLLQADDDIFTVHIHFCATYKLRYVDNNDHSGSNFGFSLYPQRSELLKFAAELRAECEDCQAHRKMDPSDDDTSWRMTH